MPQIGCPACRAQIEVADPVKLGDRSICKQCGEEWIISNLNPLRLDYEVEGNVEDVLFHQAPIKRW